jgi:hypothetical protein
VTDKYHGIIAKTSTGQIIPPDDYLIFMKKDDAVPAMLTTYYEKCNELGCDDDHLEWVADQVYNLRHWREQNADRYTMTVQHVWVPCQGAMPRDFLVVIGKSEDIYGSEEPMFFNALVGVWISQAPGRSGHPINFTPTHWRIK